MYLISKYDWIRYLLLTEVEISHFYITEIRSQQFSRRGLKPMAFLFDFEKMPLPWQLKFSKLKYKIPNIKVGKIKQH